jgi:hypothetical protein
VSVSGAVAEVAPGSDDFGAARAAYLARFPDAEPRFGFADFHLLRLVPERAQYVGGFARARSLGAAAVGAIIQAL